jgi:hypothetical protein
LQHSRSPWSVCVWLFCCYFFVLGVSTV